MEESLARYCMHCSTNVCRLRIIEKCTERGKPGTEAINVLYYRPVHVPTMKYFQFVQLYAKQP